MTPLYTMKQWCASQTTAILSYTLQSIQPIRSVSPRVIVCLYGSLACARVYVLSKVYFVSLYRVAFAMIRKVIISDPPLDLAECPEIMALPLGGAL